MNRKTDSSYRIGVKHSNKGIPNQDYAKSGLLPDQTAYFIVSDGCTAGRGTDIGARVIIQCILKSIVDKLHKEKSEGGLYSMLNGQPYTQAQVDEDLLAMQQAQLEYVEKAKEHVFLGYRDMQATAVWGVLGKAGGFVRIQGDGVFAVKRKNGDISIVNSDWKINRDASDEDSKKSSRPFYPFAYVEGSEKRDEFVQLHGGLTRMDRYSMESYAVNSTTDAAPKTVDTSHLDDAIKKANSEFNAINRKKNDLKSKISNLEKMIGKTEGTISENQKEISKLEDKIAGRFVEEEKEEEAVEAKKDSSTKVQKVEKIDRKEQSYKSFFSGIFGSKESNKSDASKPKVKSTVAKTSKQFSAKNAEAKIKKLKDDIKKLEKNLSKYKKDLPKLYDELFDLKPAYQSAEINLETAQRAKVFYEAFGLAVYGNYQPTAQKSYSLSEPLSVQQGLDGITLFFTESEIETMESATLFSDGVAAISGAGWKEAAIDLITTDPESKKFVKSKLLTYFRDGRKKPMDDIAMATIKLI